MGLFSDITDTITSIADPGGYFDAFSGKTGAEASKEAAQLQAEQFQKIYDLYKPFTEAGIAQLPQLAKDATAQGYGQNIGDILNTGALDPLIKQRQDAATNYFASRGLRRAGVAGKTAAQIPADLSMQIEQELERRRQSIAGLGQTGSQGSAGALQGIGSALAGGQLGAAQSSAQGAQNVVGIIAALASAFSDERLKEDIEPIGELGGLTVVRWSWNKLANIVTGLVGESKGFIAQEVADLYPQHVYQRSGFMTVDYDGLLEEIRHAH
jgi:hypothetical protein